MGVWAAAGSDAVSKYKKGAQLPLFVLNQNQNSIFNLINTMVNLAMRPQDGSGVDGLYYCLVK
ncbi:MAG: hypothetical protein EAZ89_20420 [Bacteroidetes bacterium]|nr:MAG: hypothetical protein EAZ89_20420 [Bacteroidota bacterium]